MYTSFYNLHSKPFQISSDPAFMWFGEKHKEALATLKYGIMDNKGFLLLTGDVGTGKTSLINSLIENLGDDIIFASVPDPSLEKMDFLNFIALAFGMDKEFSTKGTFLVHFRKFLMEAHANNKKVLLIIDESQLLSQEMLEEIRLLSNIERTDAKLINIFFVGQNEFNEILNQQQNRAVRQRLTLNYNIDPLTPDETAEYIKHRLKVAGTTQPIFDTEAVQEIFMYSGGFPRRINIICDHCLLSGYVNTIKEVNRLIVKECARELKIPAHVSNRDINGFAPNHSRPATVIKAQPFLPLPKQPEPKPKTGRSPVIWVLAFFILFFSAWFLIFPAQFKHSVSKANHRLGILKNQILPLLPDSVKNHSMPLSEKPETSKIIIKPTPAQPIIPDETVPDKIVKPAEIVKPSKIVKPDKMATPSEIAKPNKTRETNKPTKPEKTINLDAPAYVHPIQENIQDENSSLVIDTEPLIETVLTETAGTKTIRTQTAVTEPDQDQKFVLPEEKVIVRFRYDTNDFSDPGYETLKKFADILVMNPEARVLVSGHTDSEGNASYNQKLSEFRANIVRSFLLGKGAKPDQIKIKGVGSDAPIENNNTAWGRMMNRRVEIQVLE